MTHEINGIRQYLKVTDSFMKGAGQSGTMQGFVLKHGRNFKPQRTPDKYIDLRGEIKECFKNSAMAACLCRDLIYCEGYACGFIPVMHAWCVTLDGRLVELTWRDIGTEYFGIPFKSEFLRRKLLESKYYGLIDDWHNNWPLVRGKHPKSEWFKKLKGKL